MSNIIQDRDNVSSPGVWASSQLRVRETGNAWGNGGARVAPSLVRSRSASGGPRLHADPPPYTPREATPTDGSQDQGQGAVNTCGGIPNKYRMMQLPSRLPAPEFIFSN